MSRNRPQLPLSFAHQKGLQAQLGAHIDRSHRSPQVHPMYRQ
ncbi:hypothetical protein [Lysobacter gummosus]